MSRLDLERMAREHWTQWLPGKVAQLRNEGRLHEALRGASLLAQDEIDHLMRNCGYQAHEAEEVALKHFILLDPESGAGAPEWEKKELAQAKREHQRNPPTLRSNEYGND